MPTTTQAIQTAATPDQLPDMPLDPATIKEGNPVAKGTIIAQTADKKVSCGQWSCEPGKFEWTFIWDECVQLLEGEVDVTDIATGQTVTLRAGDMASFPLGMKTVWHVKQKVRKFFTVRTPDPLEL